MSRATSSWLSIAAKLVALALFAGAAGAHPITWQSTVGAGVDIGSGGGKTWLVGTDGGVYVWAGSWVRVPGLGNAARIDVDASGNAWVVTRDNKLFAWNGSAWRGVPGDVRDIGRSAQGDAMWIIGGGGHPDGNFDIYQWHPTAGWVKKPGNAVRIDVDPAGNAWVVNAQQQIYKWNGTRWDQWPGAATDIGIGGEGSVWVIGRDGAAYWWNGKDFERRAGELVNITADKWGRPWGVNSHSQAFHGAFAGQVLVPKSSGNAALMLQKEPYHKIADVKLGRTPTAWTIQADGTIRSADKAGMCLLLRAPDMNTSTLSASRCDGSREQGGWSYSASDQTIRNAASPRGCVNAPGPGVLFVRECPVTAGSHSAEAKRQATFDIE